MGGPTGKGNPKEDPSTYLRSDKSSKLFEDDKAKGLGLGQFMVTGMIRESLSRFVCTNYSHLTCRSGDKNFPFLLV